MAQPEKPGAQKPAAETARRGYHHGNLLEALVEAAAALVAERGPEGFSMLDAAKACGVSASAPYKHFADKAALLQELARRGGQKLFDRLGVAWNGGRPEAPKAFLRLGHAYLAFAREEPGYYLAMFRPGAPPPPPLDPATSPMGAALAALGVGGAQGSGIALQIWALSHGLASLERSGHLPMPAEEMIDTGVGRLLRGLAVERGVPPPAAPA